MRYSEVEQGSPYFRLRPKEIDKSTQINPSQRDSLPKPPVFNPCWIIDNESCCVRLKLDY